MVNWLYVAIDALASNYGWSREEILECVYFDELFHLQKQITKRKLANYRMLLRIQQNPQSKDPGKLWDDLQDPDAANDRFTNPQFDATGFELLKQKMRGSKGSGMLIKDN